MNQSKNASNDSPIPYALTDVPIPYRVRVATASPTLRSFVVPRLGIRGQPEAAERRSEPRLKVA
jgi:hypothetical protein